MPLKTRLQTYLGRFSDKTQSLPLIHTTSTNAFREIVSEKAIKAHKECDVFKEWLIYLFYGRPAYKVRVNEADQQVTDEYLPVAFIVRPDAVTNVKRVFPFDSGTFDNDAYLSVHHKTAKLSDFELEPSLIAARRVVKAFFGTNQNYVLGEATSRGKLNPLDHPEASAYFSLVEGVADRSVDDRRYSIEIQTLDPLYLATDILAVVMPHTWLKSRTVRSLLRAHPSITPITYARFNGATVSNCHAVIFEKVHEFLASNAYL